MWIFSPVRGLRPSEAARCDTEKVPKPTSLTSSPTLQCLYDVLQRRFNGFAGIALGEPCILGNF